MKLKDLATHFIASLNKIYQEEEANAIFLITVERLLGYKRSEYLLNKENIISNEISAQFDEISIELQQHTPIQYILGETYFYGLKFKVNPSVLIPRPETEELVAWVIEKVASEAFSNFYLNPNNPSPKPIILDIGTGSGCIAISLQKNLPSAEVYGLDVAPASLATAQENAALNKVDVKFIHQDILETQNLTFPVPISVLVSNPPYIKIDEKLTMHPNVLDHEPHGALFVSNENPLVFYEAIANFSIKNLIEKGLLFLEINENLGKETIDLLKAKGFKNIELRKDMQGKDRMICCSK